MRLSREIDGWKMVLLLLTVALGTARTTPVCHGQKPSFRVVDEFDGKLELKWEPVRLDATRVSLTKNPGKLTITTQAGTLGYDETRPGVVPAKNLHLIPNPVAEGGDFVVTTCVESFKPSMMYQQAGLLVYDDDDNYLKCDMEWAGRDIRFKYMYETDQRRTLETDKAVPDSLRTWIRITKRGNVYERAYSTDGENFEPAGEKGWGNGAPKYVGIIATNGMGRAEDIDAAFEFFEVRGLTDAEKNEARYVERKKLQGGWEVVSCDLNGKRLSQGAFSAFAFDGASVTITETTRVLKVDYVLEPDRDPKGFVLSSLSQQADRPVNGIYGLEGDTLKICLALQPGAAAPRELETTEGDVRLLITLQRAVVEDAPSEEPEE